MEREVRASANTRALSDSFLLSLASRMIREATLSAHETAEALRPALLRLARNLRRETEALGVTSHQVTLLWLVALPPRPLAP